MYESAGGDSAERMRKGRDCCHKTDRACYWLECAVLSDGCNRRRWSGSGRNAKVNSRFWASSSIVPRWNSKTDGLEGALAKRYSIHGLMIGTPLALKSATFRVTTVMR
jgi:hypothetical protein